MSACHKARAFMHHPHHRVQRLLSAFSMPESRRRIPGEQWFYTINRADSACPTADDLSDLPPSALTARVGAQATICDIHQARHSCDITVQRRVFRRGGYGATCSIIWGPVLSIIVKRFPSRRCVELYSCTAAQQSQTRGPKHNNATTKKQEHRLPLVSTCGVQTSENSLLSLLSAVLASLPLHSTPLSHPCWTLLSVVLLLFLLSSFSPAIERSAAKSGCSGQALPLTTHQLHSVIQRQPPRLHTALLCLWHTLLQHELVATPASAVR